MKSESKNRLKMINLISWDGIKGGEGGEGKDRERKWKIILIVLLKKKEME